MIFEKRGDKVRLDRIPTAPPKGLTKDEVRGRFDALGAELFALQDSLWGARIPSRARVARARSASPWTHSAWCRTRVRHVSRGWGPGKHRSPATTRRP